MSTINWINFNGLDSRDFNILVRSKDTFKRAERDISFVSVPGRSGDVVIDNGKFKNVEIGYKLSMFAPNDEVLSENENFFYNWEEICDWLRADGNYHVLVDSYDPLYYRKACLVDDLDIDQPHYSVGEFEVKFNCKPYRYRIDGDTKIEITQTGYSLYNSERYEALPYLKIYGNGNIYLNINGRSYDFHNVVNYVEVDSEMMNVYKGLVNQNDNYAGTNFPKLEAGNNYISWSGNVVKIEAIPRWRTR